MAAPATTARNTPSGIKLKEGQGAQLMFARRPTIGLWPVTIKPPGIDGGDAVEQTTQLNTGYETKAARILKTLTDSTMTCAYDPKTYSDIVEYLINAEGACTLHFPDGSTLDWYGYLQKFEPEELQKGEQPRAQVTIVATNFDPVNKTEAAPVLTEVAGT